MSHPSTASVSSLHGHFFALYKLTLTTVCPLQPKTLSIGTDSVTLVQQMEDSNARLDTKAGKVKKVYLKSRVSVHRNPSKSKQRYPKTLQAEDVVKIDQKSLTRRHCWNAGHKETKTNWQKEPRTHTLTTLGRRSSEGQVKLIRVGSAIKQAGNTQGLKVKQSKTREEMSIQNKTGNDERYVTVSVVLALKFN